MLDFSPKAQAADLGATLTAVLDAAIVERQRTDYEAGRGSGRGLVARKRIGAGYIGVECARALAYRFHRVEQSPREKERVYVTPGELQRHALSGFWTEASMAEWLRLAGFTLQTEDASKEVDPATGKHPQIGYRVAEHPVTGQAQIAGEVDGLIVGVPPALAAMIPTPCLWESKKATAKKCAKFRKSGVKGADPKYYAQLQANMGYLNVGQTLFTMLNLDAMEFYFELVVFDLAYATALVERAAKVINSSSPDQFDRIGHDDTDFRCKFCDWHRHCWRPAPVTAAAPSNQAPSWLTGR